MATLWGKKGHEWGARFGPTPTRSVAYDHLKIMPFSPIPEILEELKAGKPIVLVDDEDRENEGDIVYAAEKMNPAAMNFILSHGRGTVCLSLTNEHCDKLRLHPQ